MPQPVRGKPDSVSRFVLPDGRTAVRIPRERKHYSPLQNGYPVAEEFLDYLASEGIDAVAIDDGKKIYVFDLYQYRKGNRIGHAPYPMKRVVPLDDAKCSLGRGKGGIETEPAEWEWLTDEDLQSSTNWTDQSDVSSSSS